MQMKSSFVAATFFLWLSVLASLTAATSSSESSVEHQTLLSSQRRRVLEAPPSLPAGVIDPKPRIIQGDRSKPSQRPFFARAGYDTFPETSEILCGATLISRDIAVSAAHCQGGFNYGIRILDATTGGFDRLVPISRQIRHPKWDEQRDSLNFDLMVLKLATPLDVNDVAQPIPYNADPNYPVEGQRLMTMGYGITEENAVSNHLREASFQYISNEQCFGRNIQFNNVQHSNEVMCTDPIAGSSTCLGDSGGPLTDSDGKRLLGVVSFGAGCQADQIPDGYARVSAMADWIREQVCKMSAFPPSNCPAQGRNSLEVKMRLYFRHDFWSDETTFAVRERSTRDIVHAGPQYTPQRGADETEEFFLLPGDYTFEVWDTDGSGLLSKGQGRDGSWYLTALYDGSTEMRLAQGGADFGREQYTEFTVAGFRPGPSTSTDPPLNETPSANPELEACIIEKDIEGLFGTSCDCSGSGQITCRHASGQICKPKNRSCVMGADCCSGRDCRANICRDENPNRNRDDARLGGGTFGGAAGRQRGGKLLRG